MRMRPILMRISIVLAVIAGGPVQAGDIYGLVIGIDEYSQQKDLFGAVNDANDIARTLEKLGAREVVKLLDGAAHREAIFSNFERLAAKAQPGDTLVLSYSGHGAQERERIPGSEADGKDEVFILSGFRPYPPGNVQRIPDDDMRALLDSASHLTVIFLADSCHSGTMARSMAVPPPELLPTRYDTYGPIIDDALPPPVNTGRDDGICPDHVICLASSLDGQTTPEMRIGREVRGATSWAFARALSGRADRNRDGVVSRGELRKYIIESVRSRSESRQTPSVTFKGDDAAPAFLVPPGQLEQEGLTAEADLVLSIVGAPAAQASEYLSRLRGVITGADPDLTWNVAKQEISNRAGDRVAEPQDLQEVQGTVDKWAALEVIKTMSETRPLSLRVGPNDNVHVEGAELSVTVTMNDKAYLTLVNISATGVVNFLYPVARYNDPLSVSLTIPYRLELKAEAPFGADHVIAIASRTPLSPLHNQLSGLHGQIAAQDLVTMLRDGLAGMEYDMGMVGLYTQPES